MPKRILFVIFIVIAVEGYSQNKVKNKVNAIPSSASDIRSIAPAKKVPCSIEINPFFRYDAYPEFLSEVRPTNNYFVKLQGSSFGLNLNFKMPLLKGLKLIAGIGYYKNRFDKIVGRNRRGQNDNRLITILPPPPIFLPYFTDKYFYHCLSMNIGVENNFRLTKNYFLPVGAILQNNFTFSQYYHLTNNPIGSLDYRRSVSRYNGFSGMAYVGLQRRAGNFTFGSQLILPVYDRLSTDEVFPKETSEGNPPSKWFRGIGLGFTCNYLLTKKIK